MLDLSGNWVFWRRMTHKLRSTNVQCLPPWDNCACANVVCCSCVAAAKVPNNTQDMVRLLKSLQPLLQDAIQKKRSSRLWEAVYTITGPLSWKDFHLLSGRGASLSSSFSLCQGWGAACNFFTASSDSLFHPPLSLVFFFQSSSSPAFFTSLLTQSSHLSLGLPRLLLPSSRNSAALFGSLSSAILSTCPAHCNLLLASLSVNLLCTPVSSHNSTISSVTIIRHWTAQLEKLLPVVRKKWVGWSALH